MGVYYNNEVCQIPMGVFDKINNQYDVIIKNECGEIYWNIIKR